MNRFVGKINKDLSFRISLLAVLSMAALMMLSLMLMLFSSKKAMREDAIKRAENTLQGTAENIDNILLSVEESSGNIFFNLICNLNQPEKMYTYCEKMIETNPYVSGCAIAMRPGFYKNGKNFMAYMHRLESSDKPNSDSPIVRDENFGEGPYYQQTWFYKPLEERTAQWLMPLEDMDTSEEPMISYCMPVLDSHMIPTGVIRLDVSLSLLSSIVANAKPSPHSYCAVLDKNGSFIVHPNGNNLIPHTADKLAGESAKEVVEAMTRGEEGHRRMTFGNRDYYVFYKPFTYAQVPYRTNLHSGWSIGIAYSADDVYAEYNRTFKMALIIGIVGLLLMFLFATLIIRHQLKPLTVLSEQAKRIALGHYNEPLPRNKRWDEIGRLQHGVERMQKSLSKHIGALEQQTNTLHERNMVLHAAYNQARKADLMKIAFLHNMTNQMIPPAQDIARDVQEMECMNLMNDKKKTAELVEDIQENGESIAKTLNHILNLSEEDMRKEVEKNG